MGQASDKRRPAAFRRGALAATAALVLTSLSPLRADAAVPTVKATWAAEVNASSFRARGLVDTGNRSTGYRFDYISAAAYEANIAAGAEGFNGALHAPVVGEAKLLASTVEQEAAQRIGGLAPETAYRFRLVVKNAEGEDAGPVRTITTQEPTFLLTLPEGRAWEMVSPVDKNGGGIGAPGDLFGGGEFQAAAAGGAVTYGSTSSFGGALGAPGASQYLSVRTPVGWETANVTRPTEAGAFGSEPDGTPYRLFSSDLTRAVALAEPHSLELLAMNPSPHPLSSLATPDLHLAGAAEDLSDVVFSTCEALTPDATEVPGSQGCDPSFPNLYLHDGSGLHLLNLEPGSSVGTPGSSLAALAGAVSSGGSRIYWVDSAGALLVRDGGRSLLVDPEGAFQAASADGSIAYFTKASHLYRYSLSSESSTDLTPGGGVTGVLAASPSGAYVYYLDASGVEGWHSGSTTAVAAAADSSDVPPATGTARISSDGTRLAFLSEADLTGYDPEGATEIYRYDANTASLLCVSCNPYGVRPLGPSSIPGVLANGSEVMAHKPRAMDSEGNRLFFDSEDALVPGDGNGEWDVYEWQAQGVGGCGRASGCLGLISSGKGADGSTFIDASADGTDVFFLAGDSLVADDPGAVDLYDARVGGGFPEAEPPIPCFADACQPLPPEPDDPTPGTLFYGSEGNPSLHIDGARKLHKGKKGRHRKHKHRRGGKKHKHRGARR